MPAIITDGKRKTLALSATERVVITDDDGEPAPLGPRKPLEWPTILRDDPATKVCEACDQFGVRRDGCPKCRQFKSCAKASRYKQAVLTRSCPLGRLQHLPVVQR